MKKIIILIPVYNDWESLQKLLSEIDNSIQYIENTNFECVIINDASTIEFIKIQKPKNVEALEIINMKENKGHARCNAFGLRYLSNKNFDYLILMDGDGEDRPIEIQSLIKKILEEENISVVAKRVKRSEGFIFQFLYRIHKLLTYIFTGKKINFGNYSCLTKKDVETISSKASIWSSFSGSVKKYIKSFNEIESIRGTRYFGPSKMSLLKLIVHSFAIIAVFKNIVFLRSAFLIIFLSYLNFILDIYAVIIQFLLVIFNLLIFLVSLRENKKSLIESHLNKKDITEITHQ